MLSVKTYLTATGFPWYFKMFFFFSILFYLYKPISCRLYMCHVCVWYAWRLEYGNWLPGTSIMNDSVLPHGFQKTISNPLKKQYGIYINTKPSLQNLLLLLKLNEVNDFIPFIVMMVSVRFFDSKFYIPITTCFFNY